MRKVVIGFVVLLGIVAVLLGGAFLLREDLIRYGAGRFLPEGRLTLTRLEALDVTPSQLTVSELEFVLNESGQRLVIKGLDVAYRITSVSTAPVVDSITIASAQLSADPVLAGEAGEEDATESGSAPQLSEVLALLREFPLERVEVGMLVIPPRSAPLAFELQRGDGRLFARIASGPLQLQTEFAQADAAAAAQLDLKLTRDSTPVGDFTVTLQPTGEVYALSGSGKLDIPDLNALLGELEQASLAVPLSAAHLEWTLAGNVADVLRGTADGGGPESFMLGLQAASTVTLPAGLASGLGEVQLEFTDGAQFTVTSGAGLRLSSERVPLRVASTWNEQVVSVNAVLSLSGCELAVNAACMLGFEGSAGLGAYTLAGAIQVAATSDRYQIKTQGLTLGGLPELVPDFDLDATVRVDDGIVAAFGGTQLLLRNTPVAVAVTLDGTYTLATSTANVHAVLPELAFMEGSGALSAWFRSWPYTFDVLAGAADAELDFIWRADSLTGTVNARLKDLGGFYGDYFFGGVSGVLLANIDTSGELPVEIPGLSLTADSLDIGLPLEDLQLDFSLTHGGVLHIDSFLARVLDGTISGNDITYDSNRERNDILVKFDGLRIERMLDLVEYEGIEATGAVSGEVPLTLTPKGVEVAAGMLVADAPGGSIRYLAAATGATGNAGLDLVNQALSNYQFDSLTSDVEYTPDGELLLSMKLQGRNPNMSGGQRINLNLNLSDNVPALLESLQAAREIEDFLAEQYE